MQHSPIMLFDLKSFHQDPKLKEAILTSFNEIYDECHYIEGTFNTLFESSFREIHGSDYCLLTANGTDSLELSLLAFEKMLNMPKNSLIAVPAMSFYASAEAIINAGHIPFFIDITNDGLLDIEKLHLAIKKFPIRGVMPVNLFGQGFASYELQRLCDQHEIFVIEDAAQAFATLPLDGISFGQESLEKKRSSLWAASFSFYPTKNLGAFGDAGAIITNNEELYLKVLSLRNHGRTSLGYKEIGRNSRCDHIQACALYHKLSPSLEGNKQRKKIAQYYFSLFEKMLPQVTLLPKKQLEKSSWHLFPIRISFSKDKNKGDLVSFLKENHIFATGDFYARPLPEEETLRPFLKNLPKEFTEFNKAKSFTEEVVCLPIHPFITQENQSSILEAILSFLK